MHKDIEQIHSELEDWWMTNHEIEVKLDWNDPYKISKVKFNKFTSDQWIDMFQTEGELLGSCCSEISRIRDIFIDSVRKNFWFDVEDLHEAAFLIKNHEFEEHPLCEIVKLWELIENYAIMGKPIEVNINTPEGALLALSGNADIISIRKFFSNGYNPLQSDGHYLKSLSLVLAAVNTLYKMGEELKISPVEGYALLKEKDIAKTRTGLAIYPSLEECEKFNKNLLMADKDYRIKKIRISLEKGMEFLD